MFVWRTIRIVTLDLAIIFKKSISTSGYFLLEQIGFCVLLKQAKARMFLLI